MIRSATCLALLLGLLAVPARGAEPTVRVAALQHGTVGWELDVIQHHDLDRAEGIAIEVQPVGSRNAAAVALQSGAVDVMVSDWVWVSRQRDRGRPWTFFPWSMAVGSVMVDPEAGIDGLGDLHDRRLGIAGGAVDKSWLLLRAYYRQRHGADLADRVEPVFASPPLLNELMLRGDLPAAINYWHYGARLQAAGMEPLLAVEDMLPALGIETPVPLLGWVFSDAWAEDNGDELRAFLRASRAAKARLSRSDREWERLRDRTGADDAATLRALRDTFRAGIPRAFGAAEVEAARSLFAVLADEGGEALTGGADELARGTFWVPEEDLATWRR